MNAEILECKICKMKCKSITALASHFSGRHKISGKDYYDKYLKKENEGKCCICDGNASFISFAKGYKTVCSRSCARSKQWKTNNDYRATMKTITSETMTRTNKETLWKDEDFRNRKSDAMKDLNNTQWSDKEFKDKMSVVGSKRMKAQHLDEKFLKAKYESTQTPEFRKMQSDRAVKRHIENPEGFVGEGSWYKQGWYESKKNNCEIYYQSSYELKAFELLEKLDVVKYFNRYKFSTDYLNPKDLQIHQYIPDVEVVYMDGSRQIVEIKAEWQLEDEIVKAKILAGKEKFGSEYVVWTQKDLMN